MITHDDDEQQPPTQSCLLVVGYVRCRPTLKVSYKHAHLPSPSFFGVLDPDNLAITCAEKFVFIRLHFSSSTTVPDLIANLAQLPILLRQMGHCKFDCFSICSKQGLHKQCLHGKVTGSTYILKHTGQCDSSIVVVFQNCWRSDDGLHISVLSYAPSLRQFRRTCWTTATHPVEIE